MGIQKCENCGAEFKYKDLMKSFWLGKGSVKCENCGKIHQQIGYTRLVFFILIILPIIFKDIIVRALGPNIIIILIPFFVYEILIISLIPYIIRYKLNK